MTIEISVQSFTPTSECVACEEKFPPSEGHTNRKGTFRCFGCIKRRLRLDPDATLHYCCSCGQPSGYTNRYGVCGSFGCFTKALELLPATTARLNLTTPEAIDTFYWKEVMGEPNPASIWRGAGYR